MAVKPEKIAERLKALWPKANLSKKRLDEISARLAKKPADDADDAAVDSVLTDANDFMSFEDIARDDDRIRTLEANQKPKLTDPPTPPVPPADPPAPDDAPAWAKALLESNKKLTEDMEAIKTGKITETKKQTALQAIEASEVFKGLTAEQKAKWVDRVDVNSDISIEDQVKVIEADFTDLKQTFANSSDYAGLPPNGRPDGKPSDDEVLSIVEGM